MSDYAAAMPQSSPIAPTRAAADAPIVAVYRDVLYNPTEPYMLSEMEALGRYRAHYFGMRRVPGLRMPEHRTWSLNGGGRIGSLRERIFKQFGIGLDHAVKRVRPSVFHVQTGVDAAVALPLARRLRVPLVVTFTGFDAQATDEELKRNSLRCHVYMRRRHELLTEATSIVVVSDYLKRRMIERGCPADKLVVLNRGVDTSVFRPDPAVEREPIVLFAGRLIAVKGVQHLVAAMRSVQAQLPASELLILGAGPQRKELERLAEQLGVRARFLGMLPPEEVRKWMSRARVLCQPSISAPDGTAEALSNACLEAQAMGLPVVGTNYAGIRESVADMDTGFLVPEADSAALATRIAQLLTDDVTWGRLSTAAVGRIHERFNLVKQVARLEDLYDRLRAGGAPRT